MASKQDIFFAKIALRNSIVGLEDLKRCLHIQERLAQVGVRKSIHEVLLENGYIEQDEGERILQAMAQGERILRKKMRQKQRFFRELSERGLSLIEELAWEDGEVGGGGEVEDLEGLSGEGVLDPFEEETREFRLSEQEELEAVLVVRKSVPSSTQDLGESFGKFRILQKLGQGGMSEVYKALDTSNGREVALKLIKQELAQDQEFIERLYREATHLRLLNHPNIIKVFDTGIIRDRHYMAMEYVKGETLADRVERSRISLAEVVEIVKQIARGLEAAHQKSVVHGDIKMSNILLTTDSSKYGFELEGDPNFRVKIADFGIAKRVEDGKVTTGGQLVGTAKYLAPEQILRGELGPKVDIFALGVIAYELLAGEEPFPATSSVGYLHSNVEAPLVSLRERCSEVSESVEKLVFKMLERDPVRRYDAPALLRDIERLENAFLGNQKVIEYYDRTSAYYRPRPQEIRRRVVMVVMWTLLLLVVVGLYIGFQVLSHKADLRSARRLLERGDPQGALLALRGAEGIGVSLEEVEDLRREARFALLLKEARTLQEEERWREALDEYRRILRRYPQRRSRLEPLIRLSEYYMYVQRAEVLELEDPLGAMELYRRALEYGVGGGEARAGIERLRRSLVERLWKLQRGGDFQGALQHLELLRDRGVISAEEYRVYRERLERLEFERQLQVAHRWRSEGKWRQAYHLYERLYQRLGDSDRERRLELERIMERTWNSYLFHCKRRRGEKYEREGKILLAKRYYEQALELREDYRVREKLFAIYSELAKRAEEEKRFAQAYRYYQQAYYLKRTHLLRRKLRRLKEKVH